VQVTEAGGLHYLLDKLQAMGWLVLGRSQQALAVFDRMARQWPRDAYVLASRAHLHAQAGRRAQAIADAQALVAAHPRLAASHWFNLAYLLEADDRPAEAEPAFRRAVELDPKLDRAWYGLGLTLARLGRADEAVDALKRNTELQPMSPYGWTQLVRLHVKRAEPDEARRIIRHLKGFEPQVAAQLERETGLAA
jgi:tetratricopeptide (TPR) repeat protein